MLPASSQFVDAIRVVRVLERASMAYGQWRELPAVLTEVGASSTRAVVCGAKMYIGVLPRNASAFQTEMYWRRVQIVICLTPLIFDTSCADRARMADFLSPYSPPPSWTSGPENWPWVKSSSGQFELKAVDLASYYGFWPDAMGELEYVSKICPRRHVCPPRSLGAC